MSTPAQIKAIHALRRQVPHLDEDEAYRDFLHGLTGKRSSMELSPQEAREVLRAMERLAQRKPLATRRWPEDPKSPLVRRLLREAFAAGWDVPETAGPFDGSEVARMKRCKEHVRWWLQANYPVLNLPNRIEGWSMVALQALLELLKGKNESRSWMQRP